jgi:hypothetical protein
MTFLISLQVRKLDCQWMQGTNQASLQWKRWQSLSGAAAYALFVRRFAIRLSRHATLL